VSQSYDKPLPVKEPLTDPYWALARQHELSIQRCDECGDRHFPPTDVCPSCLSDAQSWQVVSGRGTLVSWVVFHRAYWDGFKPDVPYNCCLVRLEEGPLIVSNIKDQVPADARMGMEVRAVFVDVTDDVSLVRFVPA
jgi:uncharacterized OB-fold protein